MSYNTSPFAPSYGNGTVVSAGAVSANAAISIKSQTLCLTNLGSGVCYIRLSEDASDTASTADYPLPGGAQVSITKPYDYNRIAYISADGTDLHILPGEGF